jgi:DNA-binding response OmpR family regulator
MTTAARILIVDDEPNVRLVFRTTLESAGYDVDVAPDGASALALLTHRSTNLVLLDLRMPGLNGGEVLRLIREAGNDVPVVIVTAHGSVPDAVATMKLGALDFLSKPVAPEALRAVVAEVLRRHEAETEVAAPLDAPGTVTTASQFAWNLSRAKRAINFRRFDEAEVHLKQAIALDPRAAEAHNLLGVVCELRNDDACFDHYRAALKADPKYGPAKHNIQRFNERFTFGSTPTPIDRGQF